MRIFLIGLPGSGKTTLGKSLAKMLDLEFIDLDEVIVKNQGRSIEKIFKEDGEDKFREIEAEALRTLTTKKNVIISVGGGTPCFHDNITVMNVSGITVFFDVPVSVITERLWNQPDRENRPIIANKTKDELKTFIETLYQKRSVFYKEAKLILPGSNIQPEAVIEALNEMD